MVFSLEAAKLIFFIGWRNGSLLCGSLRLGNTWITEDSFLSHSGLGAPAPRWRGRLTACCGVLMIAWSAFILEAAEGIVDFGCLSASIFCAAINGWFIPPSTFWHFLSLLQWTDSVYLRNWWQKIHTFREWKQGKKRWPSAEKERKSRRFYWLLL